MRKIVCNNEICHAITETGLVFSWGNDIHHKGTLGLGENIYQVNTPVMNKYLSNNKIFDISLSEDHCAAIDFNNSMYTWGVGAPRTPLINNIINFILLMMVIFFYLWTMILFFFLLKKILNIII